MTTNVGTPDRIVRLLVAAVAIFIAFKVGVGSLGGIIALLVAVIMAVTAAIGFCPLYKVFGMNTCPKR